MLLEIAQWLAKDVRLFNVFNYITLRAVLACLTALAISLILGPYVIRKLTAYKIGQSVRDDGPKSHLTKSGTPTMGGALILLAIGITTLLWGDLENRYLWVAQPYDGVVDALGVDHHVQVGTAVDAGHRRWGGLADVRAAEHVGTVGAYARQHDHDGAEQAHGAAEHRDRNVGHAGAAAQHEQAGGEHRDDQKSLARRQRPPIGIRQVDLPGS